MTEERAVAATEYGEDSTDPNEGYAVPPIPYEEEAIPMSKRNWVGDYGDQVIPRGKGFITDFVYHTRGYMIPTLACIWSALFIMSSAIKREAWFSWEPKSLFANLFVVIIGPAGRAKKTTAVTQIGLPLLRKFRQYIRNGNIYKMKEIRVVKDMNTPEYLLDQMLPERKSGEDFYLVDEDGRNILGKDGKAMLYRKTSEAAVIASELSTFLSSRSYTESMSSLMLDLYDCHSDWDWGTLSRGKKTLRRMYTTFLAGTTIDGLRQSVPRAAKGDGFLSRTLLVYVPSSKRKYPMPRKAVGAPSEDELAKRLAWVVEKTIGKFELCPEAFAEYERWYQWYYQKMEDNPSIEGAISRMDVHLLKTAMLIKASRYESTDNVIEMQDLMDAIRLIDATYASLPMLLSQLDEDEIIRVVSRVELMLRRNKRMTRTQFLRVARLKTDTLHLALEELAARGVARFELGGKAYTHSTTDPNEVIYWVGEGHDDGEEETGGSGSGSDLRYSQEVREYPEDGEDSRSQPYESEKVSQRVPERRTTYKRGRTARKSK